MPRPPSLTSLPATPPAPEDFDLFADVSHHGSSLFEFLSFPPPTSPLPAPPAATLPITASTAPPTATPPPVQTVSHAAPPRPPSHRPAPRKARPLPHRSASVPPSPRIAKASATLKARPPTPSRSAPRNRTASGRGSARDVGVQDNSDASVPSDEGGLGAVKSAHESRVGQKGDASSAVDDGQSKDTHNSHTRRCRAKVNSKFQELLSILPAPPPKTGIKHKAQILDYTIRVFRDIHARKTLLEAELALSSRTQLNNWVSNVISRSTTLQDALAPYLSLVCTKGGWKYSEAWVPAQEPVKVPPSVAKVEGGVSGESCLLTPANITSTAASRLRLGLAIIPSLGNTDDPDLQSKLERFRDRSRSYACKARVDLPGRIMCTMRPEWLPALEDQEAFQRARLARAATLIVCFGVPIFVRGHVAAVAVFFDTEQRPYDAKCVDLADNIAGLLGNAFGASSFSKNPV